MIVTIKIVTFKLYQAAMLSLTIIIASQLIEAGSEYVTTIESMQFFRKRK